MKNWFTLLLICCSIHFVFGQKKHTTYHNQSEKITLSLAENYFFQYKDLSELIAKELRGKWRIEKDELILTESYHSEKQENLHHILKAPKFEYTTAQRITTFKIAGKELTLVHQEIYPENAKFLTNLATKFNLTNEL